MLPKDLLVYLESGDRTKEMLAEDKELLASAALARMTETNAEAASIYSQYLALSRRGLFGF